MLVKKTEFDLIAIGESLRDVFYELDEQSHSVILDRERNYLCVEYAEKIPVKNVVKVPAAGNASNVAVGASRLGLKSALVSWVGHDPAGDDIRAALKKDRVDTKYLCKCKDRPTSEATILNYQGERTQFVYFQPRQYDFPKLSGTRCLYYSAVGTKHDACDRLVLREAERQKKTMFVFQPGTTHILQGLKKLESFIRRSDLFILNKDEAHHLLPDGERTLKNLLESFHHLGARIVVITDGKNGACGFDGASWWHMPVFPTRVVEKTGAGDSFACGVTAALLKGTSLAEALRWGTAMSWGVVQEIGPQKGLLKHAQLATVLKRYSSIKPVAL